MVMFDCFFKFDFFKFVFHICILIKVIWLVRSISSIISCQITFGWNNGQTSPSNLFLEITFVSRNILFLFIFIFFYCVLVSRKHFININFAFLFFCSSLLCFCIERFVGVICTSRPPYQNRFKFWPPFRLLFVASHRHTLKRWQLTPQLQHKLPSP